MTALRSALIDPVDVWMELPHVPLELTPVKLRLDGVQAVPALHQSAPSEDGERTFYWFWHVCVKPSARHVACFILPDNTDRIYCICCLDLDEPTEDGLYEVPHDLMREPLYAFDLGRDEDIGILMVVYHEEDPTTSEYLNSLADRPTWDGLARIIAQAVGDPTAELFSYYLYEAAVEEAEGWA